MLFGKIKCLTSPSIPAEITIKNGETFTTEAINAAANINEVNLSNIENSHSSKTVSKINMHTAISRTSKIF